MATNLTGGVAIPLFAAAAVGATLGFLGARASSPSGIPQVLRPVEITSSAVVHRKGANALTDHRVVLQSSDVTKLRADLAESASLLGGVLSTRRTFQPDPSNVEVLLPAESADTFRAILFKGGKSMRASTRPSAFAQKPELALEMEDIIQREIEILTEARAAESSERLRQELAAEIRDLTRERKVYATARLSREMPGLVVRFHLTLLPEPGSSPVSDRPQEWANGPLTSVRTGSTRYGVEQDIKNLMEKREAFLSGATITQQEFELSPESPNPPIGVSSTSREAAELVWGSGR